jgi:alanine racemase
MPSLLTVDLAAIDKNISALRYHLGANHRIMMMVKGQAYGTDAVCVALHVIKSGLDYIGVAYVREAAALREAGLTCDLFLVQVSPDEAMEAVSLGLSIGMDNIETIQAIGAAAEQLQKTVSCHLQLNTGFHRFGCTPEEALALARAINTHPHLTLEGLMSHYAAADDPAHDRFTEAQGRQLTTTVQMIRDSGITCPYAHISNSAGAIRFPNTAHNLSRIGLSAYGVYPSDCTKTLINLTPVVTLSAPIIKIHLCKKGDTIGYSRRYTVQGDERIGVLPIGYADGIPRNHSQHGHCLVQGKRVPLIGHVCMDFLMINLTAVPNAQVSDPAVIIGTDTHGNRLSIEEISSQSGTAAHETLARLQPRIPRQFL